MHKNQRLFGKGLNLDQSKILQPGKELKMFGHEGNLETDASLMCYGVLCV